MKNGKLKKKQINKRKYNMSKISDKLTYFYIRNIKKHMICPSCGDKLLLDKKKKFGLVGNVRIHSPQKNLKMTIFFGSVTDVVFS